MCAQGCLNVKAICWYSWGEIFPILLTHYVLMHFLDGNLKLYLATT